jgi:putative proteasome-type protease
MASKPVRMPLPDSIAPATQPPAPPQSFAQQFGSEQQ